MRELLPTAPIGRPETSEHGATIVQDSTQLHSPFHIDLYCPAVGPTRSLRYQTLGLLRMMPRYRSGSSEHAPKAWLSLPKLDRARFGTPENRPADVPSRAHF